MISFVLDASVILSWAFKEEFPGARAILRRVRRERSIVPGIWWFELRNVLVIGERRGRITERQTTRFLLNVTRLDISIAADPVERALLALARRYRLTVYDAAYLELAMTQRLPLATLDKALVAAAQAERVPVIGAVP